MDRPYRYRNGTPSPMGIIVAHSGFIHLFCMVRRDAFPTRITFIVLPVVIALTDLADAEQVTRAGMTGEVEILLDAIFATQKSCVSIVLTHDHAIL